jgi:hypothetical protein
MYRIEAVSIGMLGWPVAYRNIGNWLNENKDTILECRFIFNDRSKRQGRISVLFFFGSPFYAFHWCVFA